jgi:hypothetical protein
MLVFSFQFGEAQVSRTTFLQPCAAGVAQAVRSSALRQDALNAI